MSSSVEPLRPDAASPPEGGPRVAVVGAGMAGLICARRLVAHGLEVTVVDKARGPGGRMSTRRTEHGAFDHGAQYFTVRDPSFLSEVERWIERGVVQEWRGRLAAIGDDSQLTIKGENPRYVGVPRMSALTRHLADGLDAKFEWQVAQLERRGREWTLRERGGAELGPFDVALVAVPGPQAAPLLAAAPELSRQAAAVTMISCLAVMAAFSDALDLPFEGAFINVGPLAWAARNGSKPGREDSESWVLHASPDWSERQIEAPPDQVVAELLAAFQGVTGRAVPKPDLAIAHRWRYALPISLASEQCLFDPLLGLGACGDWCAGPRVEGAYQSGQALAERVVQWAKGVEPQR